MKDRGSGSYQDVFTVAPKKTGLDSLLDKAKGFLREAVQQQRTKSLAKRETYEDAPIVKPKIKDISTKFVDTNIENLLDNFLLQNENDKLLSNTVDPQGAGVIEDRGEIFATQFGATGDVGEGQQEIGYGHLVTADEETEGISALREDGLPYVIKNSILNKKQAKDVARFDAKKFKNEARNLFNKKVKEAINKDEEVVVDSFDKLPGEMQNLLTDYHYNSKDKPNKLSTALAMGNYDKAISEGTDRTYKDANNIKKYLPRNINAFETFFVPVLKQQGFTDEQIESKRATVPKPNETPSEFRTRVASRYQGGMVSRDPYKREPRFI